MSILPSLLTSATVTPSERNLRSMTVFFQRIGAALSLASVGVAGRRSTTGASSTGSQDRRIRMGTTSVQVSGMEMRMIIGTDRAESNSLVAQGTRPHDGHTTAAGGPFSCQEGGATLDRKSVV